MKIRLRSLETLWHTVALLILMGAYLPLWRQMIRGEIDPAAGDPLLRTILALVYVGSIGVFLLYPRKTLALIARYPLPWILVGWALLSTLWSATPEITLRRSASATLATLYALVLVLRFDFKDLLRILGMALAITLLGSLFVVWMLPSWGVMGMPHEGAWQGVFFHKNILGRAASLSLLVFGALWLQHKDFRRWGWGGLVVVALVLLLGSRAVSGLILGIVMIAGGLVLLLFHRLRGLSRSVFLTGLFGVGLVATALLVSQYELFLEAFSKDPTLTGRVPLWSALWSMIAERFWLGYGYGAFWLGWSGPSALLWRLVPWEPSNAHNGYLDVWLELGMVGVVLGVTMLLRMLYLSARQVLYSQFNALEYGFWFMFSVFLVICNSIANLILESNMPKVIYWILFVVGYLRLEIWRRSARKNIAGQKLGY
jgi:exopolysaccharide production protein ExoQ